MKQKIMFALSMGVITTGIISSTLIAFNVGFTENYVKIWLRSWILAYIIVIPVILLIGPQIQKLISRVLKDKNN